MDSLEDAICRRCCYLWCACVDVGTRRRLVPWLTATVKWLISCGCLTWWNAAVAGTAMTLNLR